ncbi:uncharacterized protein LOC126737648 [Anthonomus grandis grandis]|uniref:uncharacterized protein LOC126737648 n=1 Tax=Anthonomus grandis grandis TaxID=2921223 RepID=UPI002165F6E2|nr:uncharacterized protein LOC126737648 [Anthonomus grandis grandis]
MNRLLVLACLLAVSFARPDGVLEGNDGHVLVSQSSIGTYKFAVQLKDNLRWEERLADGTIRGEYSVPDESGVPKVIRYTSGKDGFQIVDGPVPVAPVDEKVL